MVGAIPANSFTASRGSANSTQRCQPAGRCSCSPVSAMFLRVAGYLFLGLCVSGVPESADSAAFLLPVQASRTVPPLNGSGATNLGPLSPEFSSSGSPLSSSPSAWHPSLGFVRGRAPTWAAAPTGSCFASSSSCPSSFSSQQSRQGEANPAVSPPHPGSSQSLKSTAKYSFEGEEIRGPLQPLRGMILLERRETPKTSAGGVYLPSEKSKGKQLAKVLAVGPGEVNRDTNARIPIDVSPGDWTIISRHVYDSFKYNGKECVLVSAPDILAKVTLTAEDRDANPADITPLGDNLLVKIVKQPERTASGLYLHQPNRESSRGNLKRAEVVSVGPGRYNKRGERVPIDIQSGDTVVFSSYTQDEPDMKYKDDIYAFVKAADLLGKW